MISDPTNFGAFIRLYPGGGNPSLPRIGVREIDYQNPCLIFVSGENYAFYINSFTAGGNLALVNASGTYNLGALSSFAVIGGSHKTVSFTIGSVPDGSYKMTVGGVDAGTADVINDVNLANQLSARFEFSHNTSIGEFAYPRAPAGFSQKIRLRCSVQDAQTQIDATTYRSTSTSKVRTLRGTFIDYVVFTLPDLYRDDHSAAMYLSLHDNIKVNGRNYARRSENSYKASYQGDSNHYSGEFGLYLNDTAVLLTA